MISEVFNIDCMEYMKGLPDKYFDLAIVDPPYGIGNFWMKQKNTYHYGKKNWNEKPPDKKYFQELFRVSKNQIIWGANYFCHHLPERNSWLIWDKGRDADKTFMSEAELAWTSFNDVMRIINVTWDVGRKGIETGIKNIHPNQRPVQLYKECLGRYAHPGDKIFDSHMGSQSSRIAAYDMGLDSWGCEIDKDYFKDGCKRFENFKAQLKINYEPQNQQSKT